MLTLKKFGFFYLKIFCVQSTSVWTKCRRNSAFVMKDFYLSLSVCTLKKYYVFFFDLLL